MQTYLKKLAAACVVAGGIVAAIPANAQQFTMKLSQPTINDVTYEYFKKMKSGMTQGWTGSLDKLEAYLPNVAQS